MRSSGSSSRELKMLDSVSISKINLPMKVSFSHASSSRKASDSIILKIRKGDVIGYGECSPRKYVSAEDVDSVFEELLQWLKRYQTEILRLFRQIPQETGLYTAILPLMEDLGNNARCAVELCIRDMAEKICGSMLRTTVTTIHPFVPVCDSLGRWSVPESSLAEARLVKIKVGADIRKIFSEIERIKLLSDAEILVDANNSWSKSNAQDAVGVLLEKGVSWFEEPGPVRDWGLYSRIRKMGGKVLLDESICCEKDFTSAQLCSAVDAVNLRVSKLGGLDRVLSLAASCKESGIQRYYGVHVAEIGTLIPALRMAASLDNNFLGFEAGQSDLFFEADQLWTSVCSPDRNKLEVKIARTLSGRRGFER